MATHSRILAWRIPRTEEPGGLQPWGCKELDMPKNTHTQIGETAGEPKNNSSFYWERLRWYNKKSIPVSKSSTQWVISHTFEIMKNKIERRQSLENIYSVQLCTERADFWFKSKTRQSRVSLDTRWFLPMFLEEIRAGRGGGGKHKIHYEWDELLRMYIFLMDWRCLKLTSFQEEWRTKIKYALSPSHVFLFFWSLTHFVFPEMDMIGLTKNSRDSWWCWDAFFFLRWIVKPTMDNRTEYILKPLCLS